MHIICCVVCLFLSHSLFDFHKTWTGKCIGVSDGDTIKVLHNGLPVKVRLYGIDCPEKGQDYGNRAKQFTSNLVFGKQVTIREIENDRYGRSVCWVWTDDVNVNKELLRSGLAWWYKKYAPYRFDLFRLELIARQNKSGIWSQPHPVEPWVFRKEQRKHRSNWKTKTRNLVTLFDSLAAGIN